MGFFSDLFSDLVEFGRPKCEDCVNYGNNLHFADSGDCPKQGGMVDAERHVCSAFESIYDDD